MRRGEKYRNIMTTQARLLKKVRTPADKRKVRKDRQGERERGEETRNFGREKKDNARASDNRRARARR